MRAVGGDTHGACSSMNSSAVPDQERDTPVVLVDHRVGAPFEAHLDREITAADRPVQCQSR